jgi:hypothetical protein
VDEAAARRVDATVDRIARVAASGDFPILRPGAADRRRTARANAEARAVQARRGAIVERGRDSVRTRMGVRYSQFNLGLLYGRSGDVTSALERAEITVALEDLVLASAVEDLLAPDELDALTSDGTDLLLDLPKETLFPSVAPAMSGSTDGGGEGSIERSSPVPMAAGMVIVIGTLLAIPVLGLLPALFGGTLAVAAISRFSRRRREG